MFVIKTKPKKHDILSGVWRKKMEVGGRFAEVGGDLGVWLEIIKFLAID